MWLCLRFFRNHLMHVHLGFKFEQTYTSTLPTNVASDIRERGKDFIVELISPNKTLTPDKFQVLL